MIPVVLSINTNLAQLSALGQLTRASTLTHRSMERLSTGQRINRASDDPAAFTVADQLKGREKSIRAELASLDREEYRLGAREGAGGVVSDLLSELGSLVLQAANTAGLSKDERGALQVQADSIVFTLDFLSNTATHNGEQLVTGYGATSLGLGSLATGGGLNLVDGDLEKAQEAVDAAVSHVATDRGAIGSVLKANDSRRQSLLQELEGVAAEKSLILDTDYAKETSELVRAKVLEQAAIFITSFAGRQNADIVLSLLGGIRS